MSPRLIRGIAIAAIAVGLPLAALSQVIPPQGNGPAPSAQGAPHRHGSAYMRALRSLNLSDGQKSQIQSIMQSYRQKNQSVDQTTRRANSQQMRADVIKVLTPAQRTQLQAQVQQMRQQQQQQGSGN